MQGCGTRWHTANNGHTRMSARKRLQGGLVVVGPSLCLMDGFRKGMFKQSDSGCLDKDKNSRGPRVRPVAPLALHSGIKQVPGFINLFGTRQRELRLQLRVRSPNIMIY